MIPATKYSKIIGILGFFVFAMSSSYSWAYDLTFSCHQFEPYVIRIEKNKPAGVFVDIINAACSRVGFKCDVQLYPNRRSKSLLKNGQVNGNFPLGWNKKRDQWLYWTPPLMTVEYGIFTNSKSIPALNSFQDLQDKRVGVFGPSNTSYSLGILNASLKEAGFKPFQIDMVPNEDGSNLKKLEMNRLDAVYINKDVGFHYIRKFQLKDIKYQISHRKLLYYIGFAKAYNEKKVLDEFNRGIQIIEEEGVLLDILKKWGISPPEK